MAPERCGGAAGEGCRGGRRGRGRVGIELRMIAPWLHHSRPTVLRRAHPDLDIWLHHLEDEADAAFLYRELAQAERDPAKADLYRPAGPGRGPPRGDVAQAAGRATATRSRRRRRRRGARFRAWVARRVGAGVLLPMLLEEEGREVKGYLNLYREAPEGVGGPDGPHAGQGVEGARRDAGVDERRGRRAVAQDRCRRLPPERGLRVQRRPHRQLRPRGRHDRRAGRPRHRPSHAVVVAGLAGMVADALSMGSSGYLAAKSEREVFEHEIAMEKEEIRLMPELEQEELSLHLPGQGHPRGAGRGARHAGDGRSRARARGAGARGAQDRRGDQHADARGLDHRHRHGARRVHSGGAVPVRSPDRRRSGPRSRWPCCPTSASARRAASSPGAACSGAGWTCSWSGSASPASAIVMVTGSWIV